MNEASVESPLEQQITVDGVKIEMVRQGKGRPLLLMHAVDGVNARLPYFQALTQHFDVIAPWHPGFGHSEWPDEFRTVADLAYFQLTLADELDLHDAVLVGCSFGGWVAAEMAVRSTERFSHLVLADAYGIKVGDRDTRDIADLFAISQDEIVRLAFHDSAHRTRDYSKMSDRDLLAIARSREAFTFFGWNPYMHNPGLKRWLRRIRIPTLVMWGASDGIVKPDYGRAYASLIPNAQFALVPEAGHYPHLEQPQAFVRNIVEFAGTAAAGRQRA